MQEEHKHYTAFTVGYKHFEFNRLPFGLAGAPITYQAAITKIFADLMEQKLVVFTWMTLSFTQKYSMNT